MFDDKKPQQSAFDAMERAMLPRTKDGLIDPMILATEPPLGDMLYPHFMPTPEGKIVPMVTAYDFADGKIPDYLEYVPGCEKTGCPRFDGTNFEAIVYDDPALNLNPHDQYLLTKARSHEANNIVSNAPFLPVSVPNFTNDYSAAAFSVENTESGLRLYSSGNSVSLTNFQVHIADRRHVVARNEPALDVIELRITCCGHHHFVTFDASKVGDSLKKIQRDIPECMVATDVKNAPSLIANFVRGKLAEWTPRVEYKSTGFFRMEHGWLYVHDGIQNHNQNIVFATGKHIPCLPGFSQQEAFHYALSILNLSQHMELMVPLLLLVHLGPLFELFQQAGHPPRFVTFVAGTTGSLKTSLALALFRLFEEDGDTPEANFLDTEAALERKLGSANGRVLLLDDFCPAVNSSSRKAKLAKLELVIRFVGDQISKSRCKPGMEKASEFAPTGCCLVTGECTGGSRSSLLRCLVLSIDRGCICSKKLEQFQREPWLLQTHLFHFLNWAGKNGDVIIQFIRSEFLVERQRFASAVKERRLADTGAVLMLAARLVLQYGLDIKAVSTENAEELRLRWDVALRTALCASETYTHELDPLLMYLTALFALHQTGKLPLASCEDEYSADRYVGFLMGDLWWLRSEDVFQLVQRYWKAADQLFPLHDSDVRKLLHEYNLIEVTKEQRDGKEKILYTKKSGSLPGRPRMLVLRADAAAAYLEQQQEKFMN